MAVMQIVAVNEVNEAIVPFSEPGNILREQQMKGNPLTHLITDRSAHWFASGCLSVSCLSISLASCMSHGLSACLSVVLQVSHLLLQVPGHSCHRQGASSRSFVHLERLYSLP